MKKSIFLAILIFVIAVSSNAQAGFRLGVKGGANLTKISGQAFNDSYRLGYQLGGFAEIDFSKGFGIQPELLWSESNTRTASGTSPIYTNLNGNQDIKLDYLTIPILLRLNVSNMVTLHVGPQYGILINNNNTVIQNGGNAFKNGDFAMVAGIQLNLSAFRIYGRYNIGLDNINDIDNKDKWTHQQIQFGLGLRL